MKRQKKQFLILVILFIHCVAAYVGIRIYNQKQSENEEAKEAAEKITLTDLKSDDITAFSYQYEDQTLEFVKEEDTWYYNKDKTIPIDLSKITSMLSGILSVEATDKITDYDSLSDYGLDNPSNTITVTTADGTTTLKVGSENTMLSEYYLMKDEDQTVYLSSTSVGTSFAKSVEDLTKEPDTETETEPAESESATE